MGMTIDEHIEVLKSYHHGFTGCAGNLQDSIDVAVDIMSKYQKIAEIVQACGADYNSMDSYECVEEIARILTHGNDD